MLVSFINKLRWVKQRLSLGRPYELTFREVVAKEYEFYTKYIKEGMKIIDVGAHTGENMAIFSRLTGPMGHVYCFEPIPPTYERLSKVVHAMGKKNVRLFHLALDRTKGVVNMQYFGFEKSSLSRLQYLGSPKTLGNRNEGENQEIGELFSVRTETLDAMINKLEIDYVDLLKIDVEGHEINVLEGARSAFTEKRIRCCIFEFAGNQKNVEQSIEIIQKFFNFVDYKLENIFASYPPFQKRKWDRLRFAMLVAWPR